jgi:V/A-type H+-transporting ATPase subunit I
MLLPERMISTSVTCVKRDVEEVLETLSNFGEFHIIKEAQDDIDRSEYRNTIQKVEEAIINVDALIKQFANEKAGLLDIFKEEQTTKTVVTASNWQTLAEVTIEKIATVFKETEEIKSVLNTLGKEKEQLTHIKDKLSIMETINADFASMKELNLIHVIFASVPTRNIEGLQTALANKPVYLSHHKLGKDSNFICVAAPDTYYTNVDKLLKTYHAETFQIPKDLPDNTTKAIEELNSKLKVNTEKEKEQTDKLNKIGEANKKDFAAWKETAENFLLLFSTKAKIVQSGPYATIKGFTPEAKFNELNGELNKKLSGKIIVIKDDPETTTPGEHSHETPVKAMPPTKIKNNRFVKPFEELTKLYGLPKYNEIDPTPIMAITFPILFGLMFGDLGHGLLLLIGGLTVGMLIKKNQSLKNLCYIMAACGIAACVTGVLFGEFFGQSFTPLWYSPAHNIFEFLMFCMYVGIAQIMIGIAMEMGNYVVNRKVADALLTAVPKMAFFIGGVYVIYNYQLDFAAWLSGPILAAIIPFVILVVGKPIYLAIAKPAKKSGEHEEMDSLTNRLFEGGDFFTRLLGNTISYSRILALLMAHWALMLVVYTVADMVGTASILTLIVSTIIIIFGNIFVLALEGLIVFIHTLRLHFYEWFSKFYMGTGTEFTPFKKKHTHTKVVFDKETDTDKKQ